MLPLTDTDPRRFTLIDPFSRSPRDWMAALYRHRFVDGDSTIESVRSASLELLATRREAGLSTHPFYWAGFVAAGDWR